MGDVSICVEDPRYIFGDEDLVGKRLLIFSPNSGGDEDGSLFFTGYQFIFGEKENGDLLIPPGLMGDPGLADIHSFDGLVRYLEENPPFHPQLQGQRREERKFCFSRRWFPGLVQSLNYSSLYSWSVVLTTGCFHDIAPFVVLNIPSPILQKLIHNGIHRVDECGIAYGR